MDIDQLFADLLAAEGTGLLVIGIGIAFLIAVFIAISAGWFRIILSIASFAYPSARVRAMGNPLVTADGADTVSGSTDLLDLFERAARLGHDVGYGEGADADAIERLIRTHHYRMLSDLVSSVPDAIRPLIQGYIRILECREVAAILRGIAGGLPADLIRERAVAIGSLTDSAIRKISHAETIEESTVRIERAGILPGIRNTWQKVGETGGFTAFESAIIAESFHSLMIVARGIEDAHYEPAVAMAGRLIDTENLRILARGLIRNLGPEETEPFLVTTGGFEITGPVLQDLARKTDILEFGAALRDTAYGPYIEPLLEEVRKTRDTGPLETALSQCTLGISRAISSQYHLGSGPIIRYLLALELEMENLMAAAAALLLEVPQDEIPGYMVVEPE
ncbi:MULTISPECIES: V-type ATPase subunit [Methanocalculus]|uniref:V-type ATPase subunit n=1 Tax=Methanocalculus TaxID=71151 RepID=UPI0020A11271|nr:MULTISPECIES: V-type ATPase subunit [unclassified Methanocalculus]MCP1661508.1 vacuolar-type H+-ATPase subunit C/Vma6 [Methanocalculus sp. AMF5]